METRGRKKGEKSKKRLKMGEEKWAEYQKEKGLAKRKKWYSNPKNRQKTTKRVDTFRTNKKRDLIAYKGGKCSKCGYNKDVTGAYDFHHLDPKEKYFNISKKMYINIELLKQEVDKCVLVCRNCHAEIHHELIKNKIRAYTL